MIYLYLFGTCFHFIYVFMIIGKYMNGLFFGVSRDEKIFGKASDSFLSIPFFYRS